MEWKTVVIFLLALVWSFVRNYERKPRKVNPVPAPQPGPTKGNVSPKMPPLSRKNLTQPKVSEKIPVNRAANTAPPESWRKKGGDPELQTATELPEVQQNDFAEEVRFKLKTPVGAREAFIYNEIFQRRV